MSRGVERPTERVDLQRVPKLDLSNRLALRPKEAAEVLGISERALRQLLPELPVIRRGGVVLLPVEPLRAWLQDKAETDGRRTDAIVDEIMTTIRQTENRYDE